MDFRARVAWTLVSMAYAVAFLQRMATQSMNEALMSAFNITPAGIAFIASGYFWGYTAMQVPAGPLVDRFGIRRIVLLSTFISATGSLFFSLATNPTLAFLSRAILACGDALVFTCLIKLVSMSFKSKSFGLMSGLSQASGYIGGALASTPLAMSISKFGITYTFLTISFFVFSLFIGCFFCIKKLYITSVNSDLRRNLMQLISEMYCRNDFWSIMIVNASHFTSVTVLAGVWGLPMLSYYFSINTSIAGWGMIFFMLGNVFGTILFGRLVDLSKNVYILLAVPFLIRVILLFLLFPSSARYIGFYFITLDLFIFGIMAGGVIPPVLYFVKRIFNVSFISTGASICMTFAGVITAITLPLVGWAVQVSQKININFSSSNQFNDNSFIILIFILIFINSLGFMMALRLRQCHA